MEVTTVFPTGIGTATSDAAAASRSNPELAGEKIGIVGVKCMYMLHRELDFSSIYIIKFISN